MKLHRPILACMVLMMTVSCALPPQGPSAADAPAPSVSAAAPQAPASAPETAASAAAPDPQPDPQPAPPPPQSALDARLLYELLAGELSLNQGDAQTGSALVLNAARRTGDEALYKRAADMAIQSRSGPAALETTRAWRQAHPDSVDAARYELQVLIVLGRVPETEARVRHLAAMLTGDDTELFIIALPALYQRVPDRELAARTVEAALLDAIRTPALAPAAWTSIGRLRLQAGDKNGALSAARLAQAASAQSEWPALLALQLLAGGDMPEADALILRYLDTSEVKPELRVSYARTLLDQGRASDAHAQLDALTRQQPDYPEGWLVKGALLSDEHRDAEAEPILRHFLQLADAQATEPGAEREAPRAQARMMLARIAEKRGDLAAAEQLLKQIDSPDQIMAVQMRRAQILARQGKIDEARQAIHAVPEREPEDARTKLLAEAQLLRDNRQPALSYQLLAEELETDPDDETLLYDTAIAAARAGQLQDMERLLRRLIEIAPQNASAYNALGYSLADRNERLPEAKTLIEKAIELSPDDHFIQDSLGWLQFRMGNTPEARRLIEAAYKKRPDPEIAAHLGEILWTLGEPDAARAIWTEGQRLDPENETLIKTLERLRVAL
jgi:predicted Zn-dependent protease